jgi:hypothetical protein
MSRDIKTLASGSTAVEAVLSTTASSRRAAGTQSGKGLVQGYPVLKRLLGYYLLLLPLLWAPGHS